MKRHSQEYVERFCLNRNIEVIEIYKNNRTPLKCRCLICGGVIFPIFDNISKGQGCCVCSRKIKYTVEQIRYFLLEKKIGLLSEEYINAHKTIECKCLLCNNVWLSCFNRIQQGSGCARCGYLHAAKSSNNSGTINHWKTDEEMIWTASYEEATLRYLNENKIEFLWQPRIFTISNKKTYRPDLYLVDKDLWIEIKGYMREKNRVKWEWFHKEYPNSELWDKNKLKELGIL